MEPADLTPLTAMHRTHANGREIDERADFFFSWVRWSGEPDRREPEKSDTELSVARPHAVGYERFPAAGATPENPMYGEAIDATELSPSWGGAVGEMISTTEDGNRFL